MAHNSMRLESDGNAPLTVAGNVANEHGRPLGPLPEPDGRAPSGALRGILFGIPLSLILWGAIWIAIKLID
jgi:hypothetical protein